MSNATNAPRFIWEPLTTCRDGWHIGGRELRESQRCPTCGIDHESELASRQARVRDVARRFVGALFQHHRTRDPYLVRAVSLDAATLEGCVTYETASGPKLGMFWTRPAAEFFGPALAGDPTSPPRFRLIPSKHRPD